MTIETLAEKRRIAKANEPIMDALLEALARGDDAEFARLFSEFRVSADTALHMKRVCGADGVREMGMRTDRAEAVFGPDWLDVDEDELLARVKVDR